MGAGELARAPKASCFQTVVSNHQAARRDASPHRGGDSAGGDGTPPLPTAAQERGPPVRSRNGRNARCPSAAVAGPPPYRLASGWNADFLMPRIAAGSSFVKAKHLEPRSLFNVANVKVLPIPMLPILISDLNLSLRCSHTCRKNARKLFGLAHQIGKLCILDISRLAN